MNKARSLLFAALFLTSAAAIAADSAGPAIGFARRTFRSAQSPLMRWAVDGDEIEGTAPLLKWSASTCPTSSDAPRFEAIPEALENYCHKNGGRMDRREGRCWQVESDKEATWFAFRFERQPPCGGNVSLSGAGKSPRYFLEVVELHPSAVGTPGTDLKWPTFGVKTDQQAKSELNREAHALASVEAVYRQQEAERLAGESAQLKTKGTQVCKPQGQGTFLGFVEDVSGERIKVLVTAHFWGDPKSGQRDPSFVRQEYTWSDVTEWRLC
jgi:hypothetical protein